MTAYVVRRLALMLPVAFLVTIGVFLLTHLTPGDPALILLGEDRTPETIAAIHHQLGLDQPLYVQYAIWLGHIVHLDLGRSVITHQPVTIAIGERLPATFELGAVALLWSLLLAIPLGTIAAVRRGSLVDRFATGFAVGGVSIPNFFIGIVLIFVLSVSLRLFPFGGYVPFNKDAYENLRHTQERPHPGGDDHRTPGRRHHRGGRGDRGGVHLAGRGPAGSGVDPQPRLHGRPGDRAPGRLLVHVRQPAGRPRVRLARSKDLVRMSSVATSTAPIGQTRIRLLEFGREHPSVLVGLAFVSLLFLVALLAPVISPHNPLSVTTDDAYLRPLSPGHLLGTDELGRDLLSRVLWGARVSLPVAFVAISVGLFGGGLVGMACGYFGGIIDLLLMRFIDALLAFPGLILAIAIVAALGPAEAHPASPDSEPAQPDHRPGLPVRGLRHPLGGDTVLSRPWRPGADPGLGSDDQLRGDISCERPVACDSARSRDLDHGLQLQLPGRFASRRPRPEAAQVEE